MRRRDGYSTREPQQNHTRNVKRYGKSKNRRSATGSRKGPVLRFERRWEVGEASQPRLKRGRHLKGWLCENDRRFNGNGRRSMKRSCGETR